MSKFTNIWVFSDSINRLAEIMTAALSLGENISAIILGNDQDAAQAYALGASEVYNLGTLKDDQIVENYTQTVAKIIQDKTNGRALVLTTSSRCNKAVATALGVFLDSGVVTEVSQITAADDGVICKHMVYGGLALGEEKITSEIAIVALASGAFDPANADASAAGQAIDVAFIDPKNAIKCIERKAKEGSSNVDLSKAKLIVSVGRGFAEKEDLAIAQSLCSVLGAELACSRPIAESEKWLEHSRYVGISGVSPKPDMYLACGISGQIQHMVAIQDAQTIIAINKDKNAPIFEYADYGLVGDLYKVLPALTEAFKS